MLKLDRPICSLDIESTGTDVALDAIIELGVTILQPDGTRSYWCQRFDPGFPIPAEATAVHGITDADVAEMPKFADWASRIYAALQGKDLLGYNLIAYDLPILDQELRRCGLRLNLDGVRVIDACGIFKNKCPRTLEAAVKEFCGRDHVGSHGAGADATATLDVLLGQLDRFEDLAAMDLDGLAEFSRMSDLKYADIAGKLYIDADGGIRYAFGKHKDVLVSEQKGYAKWMMGQNFPASTLDVLDEILKG